MLNENEKLVSWDVWVLTTNGRKLSSIDLDVTLPDMACEQIDELFSEKYPCLWTEDNDQNCNVCAKLGKTTCGNDMDGRCFEPIS